MLSDSVNIKICPKNAIFPEGGRMAVGVEATAYYPLVLFLIVGSC